MLHPERIPLNEAEQAAIEKLEAAHPGTPFTLTRQDPGETGPLLVHIGDDTYLVREDGKRKKVTG